MYNAFQFSRYPLKTIASEIMNSQIVIILALSEFAAFKIF